MRVAVVVPAGGAGRRMGGEPKPFLRLAGEPILAHALRPFLARADVQCVIVALPSREASNPPSWLSGLDPRVRLVRGGAERGDSVEAGLAAVPDDAEVIAVHDAARPLLPDLVLARVLEAAAVSEGAIAAIPAADTLKEVDAHHRIVTTPDRQRIWLAQTPQAFPREVLMEAYRRAAAAGVTGTDDSSLVEWAGGRVRVIEGSQENLKITRPDDLVLAEAILAARRRPS